MGWRGASTGRASDSINIQLPEVQNLSGAQENVVNVVLSLSVPNPLVYIHMHKNDQVHTLKIL